MRIGVAVWKISLNPCRLSLCSALVLVSARNHATLVIFVLGHVCLNMSFKTPLGWVEERTWRGHFGLSCLEEVARFPRDPSMDGGKPVEGGAVPEPPSAVGDIFGWFGGKWAAVSQSGYSIVQGYCRAEVGLRAGCWPFFFLWFVLGVAAHAWYSAKKHRRLEKRLRRESERRRGSQRRSPSDSSSDRFREGGTPPPQGEKGPEEPRLRSRH